MEQRNLDYARSGLNISEAVMEAVSSGRTTGKRPLITWDGHTVTTGDIWEVPPAGRLTITIDQARSGLRQGLEIQIPQGGIVFADGTLADRMHMWHDDELTNTATYRYSAPSKTLLTCNIYEQTYDGRRTPRLERWGAWAGMWIQQPTHRERVYHCNHGETHPPTFQDLTYRLSISVGP